jgi:hypothetical protein
MPAYSQTLAATGGTPPYSWTINSGALPPGLVLSAAGIISGEPTTIGTFTFMVQVTDSAGASANRPLSIQIGGAALLITTGPLPPAVVGAPYAQTLSATGGIAGYRWSISSGSLPPGLTLDSAGSISGSPTSAGTFTFAAQASDSSGLTANKNLSITVGAALVLETKSLADASLSAAYAQSLRASGGTSPYTWSVTAGALPDGIRLESTRGLLNGTAGAAGTFTFTIRVTDSTSVFTERQFTIETAAGLIITSAPNGWSHSLSSRQKPERNARGACGGTARAIATGDGVSWTAVCIGLTRTRRSVARSCGAIPRSPAAPFACCGSAAWPYAVAAAFFAAALGVAFRVFGFAADACIGIFASLWSFPPVAFRSAAQRFRVDAAIRLLASALRTRFGFLVSDFCCLATAQRFLWAAAIRLRAAALITRLRPVARELTEFDAESARSLRRISAVLASISDF